MTAYANRGDMSKAMATYERYARVLWKEAKTKPSEQTQALNKRLKTGWKAETRSQLQEAKPDKSAPDTDLPGQQRSNLPRPLTHFIGREKEIHQVESLVTNARLTTITGPGGVGKTRLAIQAAGELASQFKDGVWWVELASITETSLSSKRDTHTLQLNHTTPTGADLVARAVAKALQILESPGTPLMEKIIENLREKGHVLVLDNCEHLIDACAKLVERVLGSCPGITILATSREALGVPGEKAWVLPALSLPGDEHSTSNGHPLDIKAIVQSEAVCLFIERASDVLSGYQPGEAELLTIAQICRYLDGVPLAIELAAARMNLLSAQEIAERLDHRFSLLTDGRRTALPYHQTMLAAIEWSYDLLGEPERTVFRRLSVFAGSFTLEATEAICTGQDIPGDEVLTLLGRLVDKSLVNVEHAPQDPDLPTRYRLLDTMRSFGQLKLEEAEETRWIRDQRTNYYVRLAEENEPALRGPKQLIWLARLKVEHNNLRAALQWALDTQDTEGALKMVGSLWRFWWVHSHHNEGREWMEKVLSMAGTQPPALRAKALNGAGILARGQGDFTKASTYLNQCLEIQRPWKIKMVLRMR